MSKLILAVNGQYSVRDMGSFHLSASLLGI